MLYRKIEVSIFLNKFTEYFQYVQLSKHGRTVIYLYVPFENEFSSFLIYCSNHYASNLKTVSKKTIYSRLELEIKRGEENSFENLLREKKESRAMLDYRCCIVCSGRRGHWGWSTANYQDRTRDRGVESGHMYIYIYIQTYRIGGSREAGTACIRFMLCIDYLAARHGSLS